jgi:hypothetical protein
VILQAPLLTGFASSCTMAHLLHQEQDIAQACMLWASMLLLGLQSLTQT